MDDFIDRQAFIEDVKTEIMNLYLDGMKGTPRPRDELYDLIDRINEQPAVDAVEVVRCKDCKHWIFTGEGRGDCTNGRFHLDGHADPTMEMSDFCSLGERRTNNG